MRAFATRHARALIAAVVAAAALLLVALGAATLGPDEGYGWKGSADSSTSSTTSTSTTSSSTTSSSTTTTEPATLPPRPTTTVAPPPPRPAQPPTTAEPERPAPPTTDPQSSEPCAQALVGVRAVGLPAGWDFFCSAAKAQNHAGLAFWNSAGGSFIAINPGKGDHPGVGAHEACHAQEFVRYGETSESSADACAEAHGYVNPYAGTDDIKDFFTHPEIPE